MATSLMNGVRRHLRRAALPRDGGSLSDGQLLERFLAARDEAAFAALMRRHGAMVLGVCRRVLRHAQDAEDAFQAAFIVFVRKAPTITRRESVGSWLYGVAYRAALEAQAARRRRSREWQPPGSIGLSPAAGPFPCHPSQTFPGESTAMQTMVLEKTAGRRPPSRALLR